MNQTSSYSDTKDSGKKGSSTYRGDGGVAREWWTGHKDDKAAMAQLRRARGAIEVLQIRPAVVLIRQLGGAKASALDYRTHACMNLARVLAHVREDSSRHPMRELGWPQFPGSRRESEVNERPKLSESRFRRLLESNHDDDISALFIRLIALMNGSANVATLAKDFLKWTHPLFSDQIREQWAFQYYAASDSTPSETKPISEDISE